jgi:hypothetical protein
MKRIAKEKAEENKGIEIRSSRLSENPKIAPSIPEGINNNQIMHIIPSMLINERRNWKRSARKISLLFRFSGFGIYSILL